MLFYHEHVLTSSLHPHTYNSTPSSMTLCSDQAPLGGSHLGSVMLLQANICSCDGLNSHLNWVPTPVSAVASHWQGQSTRAWF